MIRELRPADEEGAEAVLRALQPRIGETIDLDRPLAGC